VRRIRGRGVAVQDGGGGEGRRPHNPPMPWGRSVSGDDLEAEEKEGLSPITCL